MTTGGEGQAAQRQVAMARKPGQRRPRVPDPQRSSSQDQQLAAAAARPAARIGTRWRGSHRAIARQMPTATSAARPLPSSAQLISAEISGSVVLMMATVTASERLCPSDQQEHRRRDAERAQEQHIAPRRPAQLAAPAGEHGQQDAETGRPRSAAPGTAAADPSPAADIRSRESRWTRAPC